MDPIYVILNDGSRILARFVDGTYQNGVCVCNLEYDVPITFSDVDYIEFSGGDKVFMP